MRFREALDSFLMNRESKNCARGTVEWYELILNKFHTFLAENKVNFGKYTKHTLRAYLRHPGRDLISWGTTGYLRHSSTTL